MSSDQVRFSVGVKMMLATTLLVSGVIAGLGLMSARALRQMGAHEAAASRRAGKELVDHLTIALVKRTALSARGGLIDTNYSLLKELVDSTTVEFADIAFVQVLDEEGRVVADSRKGAPERDDRADFGRKVSRAAPNEIVTMDSATDPTLRIFGVRLAGAATEQSSPGQLRLGYSMGRFERRLSESLAAGEAHATAAISDMMLVAGTFLLLGIALAFFQSRRISRPITRLTEQATRIADGDLTSRVEIHASDEIGKLSRGFNHMADRIAALLDETAQKAVLERELEVARIIQETLVPPSEVFQAGALQLASHYQPASVCGGDFWTYQVRPDGCTMLVIGDVTGHGVPAALITAAAVGCLESIIAMGQQIEPPIRILNALNRAIYASGHRQQLVMTCHVAVLDPKTGLLHYANAAHTFPYVIGENHEMNVLGFASARLGDSLEATFKQRSYQLQQGDYLVWYTDGAYECWNSEKEQWGDRRFRAALRKGLTQEPRGPRSLRDSLLADMNAFTQQEPLADDVTLLVGRFMPAA